MTDNIDAIIKKRISEINQIKEEFGIEDIEVIKDLVKNYFEMLPARSPGDKFKRALAFAASDLGQFGGEKFTIAVFGYDSPRDWNSFEVDAILKAWEQGQVAQNKLIEDGKIMTKNTPKGKVAVSSIPPNGIQEADNGEPVVVVGTELTGDEQPIPRHYKKMIGTGEKARQNKRYGYPMTSNWTITMHGVTHNGSTYVPFIAPIYSGYDGDWANPESDDFLPKKAPACRFYSITAQPHKDLSTEELIRISRLTSINPLEVKTPEGDDMNIRDFVYNLINEGVLYDFKRYQKASAEEREVIKDGIFLVDISDLEEFHTEIMAMRDKDGNVVKGKTGWDRVDYSKYGLGIFVCKEVRTTKKGTEQLVLVDSAGKKQNAFMDSFSPKVDIEAPAECLVAFKTNRKPTRWDKEAKTAVEDHINGDVTFGHVLGAKSTFKLG